MYKVFVINGPNLNFLGERESKIYGKDTLSEINSFLVDEGNKIGVYLEFFQSNCEGDIIDKIYEVHGEFHGFIINPGAFTHYSYAIYDAILSVDKKFVEVHLSNIYNREEFRCKSVTAKACIGQISGFGKNSYLLALYGLKRIFTEG